MDLAAKISHGDRQRFFDGRFLALPPIPVSASYSAHTGPRTPRDFAKINWFFCTCLTYG